MLKTPLKTLTLLCFAFLMCVSCAIGISAEESTAESNITSGGFYRIYNKTAKGYLTVTDGGISFGEGDGAESIIEISEAKNGAYTLRFISKKSDGYIKADLSSLGQAEGAASFSVLPEGEDYTLSVEGAGKMWLGCRDGAFAPSQTLGDGERWTISEYKPESMTISQTEIDVKPYISYNDLRVVISPAYLSEYVEWDSSDRKIVIVDDTGKFCSLAEGDATVVAKVGAYSVKCKINVAYDNEFAWFSQNNVETGGWNGKSLYNIYFRGGGYRKRFGFNGSTKNNDWLSEGCALCSISQVLNNMGARLTEGYDVRSGLEGNLIADPYTVALANTDNHGATSFSETLWGDPVFTRHNAIAARFNYNGAPVTVSVKYTVTKKTIKEALDKCPWGVVVRFDNASYGSHYITFNKCINPDAENWRDYKFLVSDPVAVTGEAADNVLFEESYSYKRLYYRFSNATIMQVWDYEK